MSRRLEPIEPRSVRVHEAQAHRCMRDVRRGTRVMCKMRNVLGPFKPRGSERAAGLCFEVTGEVGGDGGGVDAREGERSHHCVEQRGKMAVRCLSCKT